MKEYFKTIKIDNFDNCFPDEESCLEFLAGQKWKEGFVCRKCGNTNYCSGKTPYSRRCTRCKHEESASSHTVFHNCRIPLNKAFKMAFMVCHAPDISTYKLSHEVHIRQMTCWKFKTRIVECIEKNLKITDFDKLLHAEEPDM